MGGWRGFYAIVDPDRCAGREPETVARAILEGGCAVLQLRAKHLGDRAWLQLARRLRACANEHETPFVVNDRADIATLAGADGLHLGQDDLEVADARQLVGSRPVGVSTHGMAQARAALESDADVLGLGPIYPTGSKANPDPVVGTEELTCVCTASSRPVIAIGGITLERVPDVVSAGATLVAAISAVCEASDPAAAARAFHEAAGTG